MKAFIVPLLAAALAAPLALGQPTQSDRFSLASAIDRAQQHNGGLLALTQEIAALQARGVQAGTPPNPSLEYLREGKHEQGGAITLQVAIPFELGGKRGARLDANAAEMQLATADLAVARMRVRAEVVAAYHEAYLAEQRLDLATQASAAARESTRSASARVTAGKISPVEETKAKVAEANLQIEAIEAKRDLAEARTKLALLWGGDAGELPRLATPDGRLPAAPSDSALTDAIAKAPLLQRAAAELDWRNASVRLERSNQYPDLSLILGTKREGVGRERQSVVGVSLPLPLFNRNQGAIIEAERRVDKSRAELESARQRLRAEASMAAARLTAALAQERVIREDVLPGGRSAFVAASKGFDAGKFNFLDVLDAQRTYFQAQAQHLRAIADAHRAAAALATLVGLPAGTTESTDPSQETP